MADWGTRWAGWTGLRLSISRQRVLVTDHAGYEYAGGHSESWGQAGLGEPQPKRPCREEGKGRGRQKLVICLVLAGSSHRCTLSPQTGQGPSIVIQLSGGGCRVLLPGLHLL